MPSNYFEGIFFGRDPSPGGFVRKDETATATGRVFRTQFFEKGKKNAFFEKISASTTHARYPLKQLCPLIKKRQHFFIIVLQNYRRRIIFQLFFFIPHSFCYSHSFCHSVGIPALLLSLALLCHSVGISVPPLSFRRNLSTLFVIPCPLCHSVGISAPPLSFRRNLSTPFIIQCLFCHSHSFCHCFACSSKALGSEERRISHCS